MTTETYRVRYWPTLAAQLILLFIAAAMKDHAWIRVIFAGMMTLVFLAVIGAIWHESILPKIAAIATAGAAIFFGAIGHILTGTMLTVHFERAEGAGTDWMMVVSTISYTLFIIIAIISIARHIFLHDRITNNVIAGGICIYMLIGMGYAFLFATIALVVPNIFNIPDTAPAQVGLTDFFYLSFSNLTTVGTQDMMVKDPIVRMIACVEAITGNLFIAIMIAGLVGTYFAQRKNRPL